jgi:hypothetical protein
MSQKLVLPVDKRFGKVYSIDRKFFQDLSTQLNLWGFEQTVAAQIPIFASNAYP